MCVFQRGNSCPFGKGLHRQSFFFFFFFNLEMTNRPEGSSTFYSPFIPLLLVMIDESKEHIDAGDLIESKLA